MYNQKSEQGKTDDAGGKVALLAGNCCLFSSTNHSWIIDSGSTDHICPTLENFAHYDSVSAADNTITIPDGKKVKVLHIGTVKLNDDITLKNVLHVPEFQFRLISVSKLCEDFSCIIVFTNNQYFLQGHSLRRPQILLGSMFSGLYSVQDSLVSIVPAPSAQKYCNTVKAKSSTKAQI